MKVLEVTGIRPNKLGGFERYCIGFSSYLQERGHEHILFFNGTPCAELRARLDSLGVQYLNRKFQNIGIKDAIYLARFIRLNKIDVVHLHFCGVPYNMFTLLGVMLPCKIYLTYHMALQPVQRPKIIEFAKMLRNRLLGLGVSRFICVSEYCKISFLNTYHERPNKVAVIHNGLEVDDFKVRATNGIDVGAFRVICVASLTEQKGVDDLLHAVAMVAVDIPSIEVNLVGTGPQELKLKKQARDLGIENHIKFLGIRSDVPLLLAKSDVAVIPSRYDEAFGFSVIEAMAARLPIIATSVGGIPEIINHETGILVSGESPKEIAKALISTRNKYDNALQRAEKARRYVEQKFTIDRVCQDHERLYADDLH
jgi:glycosyltransferase involved in cell wall biosynthesis